MAACALACGGGGGASDLRESEPNDTPATALDLGLLGSAAPQGTIEAGDVDLFRFDVPGPGRLVARLEIGADADLDLALLDATGARVTGTRADNTDPSVGRVEPLFADVGAGRHLVLVEGTRASYRLQLSFTPDAFPGPPSTATTEVLAPLDEARCFHVAAALPDGDVLVVGGTRDPSGQAEAVLAAIRSAELLEGTTRRSGPDLSAARFGPTATVLPTGRVLIAGGDLAGTADLYDPARGDFVATGIPLPDGVRVLATATLLADGRVLLAGGTTIVFTPLPAAQTLATTAIFDPKTRAFTAGPALRAPRASHAAVRLADGRVLIAGGVGRSDTEVIDAAATGSITGPPLTTVRDDHAATLLPDGRVLVTGGQDATGRSLDSAEILDPGATTFRPLTATMGSRRADHEALRLPGGGVLLLGGEDDPADGSPDTILDTVEWFDPATETFLPMPPLAVPRDDHRVARLPDGGILVTGGEDETSTSIAAVEVYRPR